MNLALIKTNLIWFISIFCLSNNALNAQKKENWNYRSQYATVENVRIHYVKAGTGSPILLLHGFPETIYTWRYIIPELSKKHTVIAIDLPGIGQSGPSQAGYDQKTIASLLHNFMVKLGYEQTAILAHDLGVEMAYGYASAYSESVTKVVFLDVPIATEQMEKLPILSEDQHVFWWFAFHNVKDLPEDLVKGKEYIYLNWFFQHDTYNREPFSKNNVEVYAKSYAKPGIFHAAMEYYRAFLQNIKLNKENTKKKLLMPVLALGGDKSFGMNTLYSFQQLATNIKGGSIENCGHFIQEEQPQKLLDQLIPFLENR
ncbi:MAG: alpha/beta hydrolase [Arachidicoccus sp.]|nr:alpha/beta hydrolase [Arachidicoccus sp.]